ncbi:MAG: hypothetical protein PHQ35_04010 [Phycisphaerae bacterium]|nr:hypothetical protein [Phycisphaerae bacterium]MDD5380317.1 hypothetical protein [Phycisphaerae bacterium]
MNEQNNEQKKKGCSNNATTALRITKVEQLNNRVALTVDNGRVIHIRDLTGFPSKRKAE